MKINLRIGQIVVEGASLTRRERDQLAAAIEQELVRGLSGDGGARPPGPGAPLGLRIAHEVLTALPPGALPCATAQGTKGPRPGPPATLRAGPPATRRAPAGPRPTGQGAAP